MDRIGRKTPIKWYIREWREYLQLTQEQVAERCETNKGQISKLERGDQRMNDHWIAAFSHAYGISPGDLLRDPLAPSINDLLRGASPSEIETIKNIVEAVLKKAS